MKTASSEAAVQAPSPAAAAPGQVPAVLPHLITATSQTLPEQVNALARARSFAEPLIATETMESGENTMAHADAVAAILKTIGGSETMQAAIYLVHASVHLNRPQEVIAKAFGENFATWPWKPTSSCACSSRRAAPSWAASIWTMRPRRPRTCARCCWASRAICVSCCCGWPRACRRCATTRPASARSLPALRARR